MKGGIIDFFRSLTAAGFAATAISYGPARMGFGLFVPAFRAEFGLSAAQVGLISSLGFAGFLVGLLIAQGMLGRLGPIGPVLSGLTAATTGLLIVALTPDVTWLAIGVCLAASSAGFAWTPFNDAVHRKVRDVDRPTALSEISTGTSVGIALAGLTALSMALCGIGWRVCWGVFAGASALALVGNGLALRRVERAPQARSTPGWRALCKPAAAPLAGVAFTFGVTSAVYISFAAGRFAEDGLPGVPPDSVAPLVFICYGLFGLAGLLTDHARHRLGLHWLLRLLFLASAGSLALAGLCPDSPAALVASAGLQGINVMMTSAVLAFWSERLFPALPALGFTATLLAMATGSVLGPALAGQIGGALYPAARFLGTALLPLLAAAFLPGRVTDARPGSGLAAT
ncbi:MFS transporter [Pseudoponticoccus marisrubri]|uniref:MFS transporter n=1 Tax=Pseudoponticoccus marisrubri TaxID=1685382 RepID=UPI0009FDE547|nr:MFS transporter [Pseudoponticoccus marisrubri]